MKCPGQDTRYWQDDSIFEANCPKCRHSVEFFKDDTMRKCSKCGHKFVNPNLDFGCATYCEFAEQCIGALPPELLAQKEDLLKDRVAIETKKIFKSDFEKISHASRAARYAEIIGKKEGGNLAVILSSAYLHDTGLVSKNETVSHEKRSSETANKILTNLKAIDELIKQVCEIIENHHSRNTMNSVEFKVVYDAILIASLEEELKNNAFDKETLKKKIEEQIFTETGKKEAYRILL